MGSHIEGVVSSIPKPVMMADAVVESSNRSGSYSSEFTESEGQIYYAISDFKADQTDQVELTFTVARVINLADASIELVQL